MNEPNSMSTPPLAPPPEVPPPVVPATPAARAETPTVPKRRRRRLWLWVTLSLLILILIVVLLIPTIVSSSPVRSYVLGQVNGKLNGKLQIASWSVGWGGGISFDGLRLDDANGRQILQLPHFHTDLTLLNAIRGKYNVGKVVIDGLDFYAERDANGVLNFSKLVKASSAPSPANPEPKPTAPSPKPSQPSKLPDFSGELVLTNCRGTIEDLQQKQTAHLSSLEADVNVPAINSQITDSLTAVMDLNGSPAGKLSVKGSARLVKNNVLMSDPLQLLKEGQLDQKITLDGVELASLAPLLGPGVGLNQLSGGTQGQVTILLKPGSNADLDALLRVSNIRASGTALKGDTFAAQQLEVAARHVTISLPADATDIKQAHVTTGATNGSSPTSISLVIDPKSTSAITLFADASLSALQHGAISKPGEPENVHWDANIDLARLASTIPHVLGLSDQLQPTSGRIIASGNGSSNGQSLSFNSQASIQHLNSGQAFKDFTIGFVTALTSISDSSGTHVTVSKFDIADNQSILHIQKAADISAAETADGHMSANGKIQIAADLRAINQILKAISATAPEVVAKTDQGTELRSGSLNGTLSLASGADQQIKLGSDLQLTHLTVSDGPRTPLNAETVSIALAASAKDDLSSAQVSKLDATGSFLTAHVSDTDLLLKNGSGKDATAAAPLEMLRKATILVEFTSLAKLSALQDAFSPPPVTPAATTTSEKAGSAPPTTTPAKPKAKPAAGSAVFTLNASRGSNNALMLASTFAAKDLAMDSGQGPRPTGPIDFKSDMAIVPAAAPAAVSTPPTTAPSMMSQIQQIDIADLIAHAGGTEISLKQPVSLKNLAGLSALFPTTQPAAHPAGEAASLDVALLVKGELAALSHFLEAMDGAPAGSEYPYAGPFTFDQSIKASNGTLALNGQGNITNFQMIKDGAPSVTEPNVTIANDVTLASSNDLNINNLAIQMPTSKTIDLVLKGTIHDLNKQRQMALTADLGYDMAKLRELAYPLMSKANQEQIKDIKVTGQFTKKFTVDGSYPADLPFNEAVKPLKMRGGLEIATLAGRGIDLKNLNVPLFLRDGILLIANSDKPGDYPGPASMNTGQFSISGAKVDLTDVHPQLTMIPGTVVLRDVALNPTLADVLGQTVGNFLFLATDNTTGLLNVTMNKCDRLPLDDTMQKNVPTNNGFVDLTASVKELTLSGGSLGSILTKASPVLSSLGGKGIATGSFKGSVKEYRITLNHGVTTHNMTVTLGEHDKPLHLTGDVNMESKAMSMNLQLPLELIAGGSSQIQAILPNGVNLPVGGTLTAPQFDFGAAVQKSLIPSSPQDLIQRLPGLINNKGKGKSDSSQPADSGKSDPLGGLGDLFNKKKK